MKIFLLFTVKLDWVELELWLDAMQSNIMDFLLPISSVGLGYAGLGLS